MSGGWQADVELSTDVCTQHECVDSKLMSADREKSRKALVLGATGLVGSSLLNQLLKTDLYGQVYAVTRRPLDFNHPLVTPRLVDFDHIENDLSGILVDDVFSCFGTTLKQAGSKEAFRLVDLEYHLRIARLVREYAEHYLLVSALGASTSSRFFYSPAKGELEQALLAMHFPYTTILRPSLLAGKRREKRFIENMGVKLVSHMKPLLIGPFSNFASVHAADVASALLTQAHLVAGGQRSQTRLVLESSEIQNQMKFA